MRWHWNAFWIVRSIIEFYYVFFINQKNQTMPHKEYKLYTVSPPLPLQLINKNKFNNIAGLLKIKSSAQNKN